MVMQSGLEPYVVVGSPGSPSGAVYVNDKRGTGKDANVRISVQINVNKSIAEHEPAQFEAFHAAAERSGELLSRPQAVGKVIPVYVATKTITPGTELLTDYKWTAKEWRDAIEFAKGGGGSSSGGSGSGDGAGADSSSRKGASGGNSDGGGAGAGGCSGDGARHMGVGVGGRMRPHTRTYHASQQTWQRSKKCRKIATDRLPAGDKPVRGHPPGDNTCAPRNGRWSPGGSGALEVGSTATVAPPGRPGKFPLSQRAAPRFCADAGTGGDSRPLANWAVAPEKKAGTHIVTSLLEGTLASLGALDKVEVRMEAEYAHRSRSAHPTQHLKGCKLAQSCTDGGRIGNATSHNRGAIARTMQPFPTTAPTHFRSAACDEHTSVARLPNSPQTMLRCTVTDRMLRDGCKLVDFDATLGYPGEGPDSGVQRMHAALAEAAKQACTDDVVRKRKRGNKYTLQDRHGRDVAFESMDTEPEDAAAIRAALGSDDISTSSLWVGDDMTQIAEAEEGFLGTVSFFNVDNLAFGTNAMQQVVAEATKVRCMIQGIGDHRSDWVNVGGRVEQAYKSSFGGSNVRFVHSCCKGSTLRPEIGECSVAVMPELRSRAMDAIRDRRKWGRYAGTLIEGRMVGGVRRRTVFLMVYAACGDGSSAGRDQQREIDKLVLAGDKSARGKKPLTMLLHDLSWELARWRQKGCTVVVGGDFNQRHDRPGREWRVLERWRKSEQLGDVLRRLHPGREFVTYRSHGKRTASGEFSKIATWVDHCFASESLLSSDVIFAAGVLDKRRHFDSAGRRRRGAVSRGRGWAARRGAAR